jgi:hypothetical protein
VKGCAEKSRRRLQIRGQYTSLKNITPPQLIFCRPLRNVNIYLSCTFFALIFGPFAFILPFNFNFPLRSSSLFFKISFFHIHACHIFSPNTIGQYPLPGCMYFLSYTRCCKYHLVLSILLSSCTSICNVQYTLFQTLHSTNLLSYY